MLAMRCELVIKPQLKNPKLMNMDFNNTERCENKQWYPMWVPLMAFKFFIYKELLINGFAQCT